jgi:hypothetical protein
VPAPKGQPYIIARGSISHPYTETRTDQNDNKYPVLTNGFKEATKMLNPLNPCAFGDERDQDYATDSEFAQGDNLGKYGVFWSRHNPPLESEVEAATKRMVGAFSQELERMGRAKTADEALALRNKISSAAAIISGSHRRGTRPTSSRRITARSSARPAVRRFSPRLGSAGSVELRPIQRSRKSGSPTNLTSAVRGGRRSTNLPQGARA